MKVCFVNKYGEIGGGEIALLLHAMDVKRRGGMPYVALRRRGSFSRRMEVAGLDYTTWPLGPKCEALTYSGAMLAGQAWTAVNCLVRRVEVVWVYTLDDLIQGIRFFRCAGCRVLFRAQGEVSAFLAQPKPELRRVRAALASCDGIACTTLYEQRELFEHFGLVDERVRYVPLGIDCGRFRPAERRESGCVQLGFFGRLAPCKGLEVVIRALGRVQSKAWWRLMVVGDASFGDLEYEKALRLLTRQLGLEQRIEWLGFRENVAELMQQCAVVVHTPWREPFGLVVAEAMACEACVVVSDARGPAEIVESGKTGMRVPVGNVEALRAALEHVIDSDDLRRRLGAEARKAVCGRFDVGRSMDALNEMTARCRQVGCGRGTE